MGARIWMYFMVFLAILVSLNKGDNSSAPKANPKVVVEGNNNAVNLCHDKEIKTALVQIQKKLETLERKMSILANPGRCNFDFESGIHDWKKNGTAFNTQPTYGDNPTARNRGQPANQQGDWWIGGAENRPSKAAPAGRVQGDGPQGTLTSPSFKITGKHISFLIGGGCDIKTVRAELIVGHKVVRSATGKCSETMTRKVWDVHAYVGQKAHVKLVDFSSGGWGHINFDDLKGDISCV